MKKFIISERECNPIIRIKMVKAIILNDFTITFKIIDQDELFWHFNTSTKCKKAYYEY